jgi:hypothetical protein
MGYFLPFFAAALEALEEKLPFDTLPVDFADAD